MGEAIIQGLLKNQLVKPEQILAYDIRPQRVEKLKGTFNITTAKNREELVGKSDIIIIAVKPQNLDDALRDIKVETNKLVISIAAGVTLNKLSGYLGEVPIVRAMPNTPALIGEGIAVLSPNKLVKEEVLNQALSIFRSIGQVLVLPEEQLNAVTALSGSGPAYIYLIIEALADGGVKQGLARPIALQLAAQTVVGAAKMVQTTKEHPGILKDRVTSPGGTTIAGLSVLEDRGVRGAVIQAVEAAANRAKSLSKE